MSRFRPYHAYSEETVTVTQIVDDDKVECLSDFGRLYVFTVAKDNVAEIEKKLIKLEEMRTNSDSESSEELNLFAVAPNSRCRNFQKLRITS